MTFPDSELAKALYGNAGTVRTERAHNADDRTHVAEFALMKVNLGR